MLMFHFASARGDPQLAVLQIQGHRRSAGQKNTNGNVGIFRYNW